MHNVRILLIFFENVLKNSYGICDRDSAVLFIYPVNLIAYAHLARMVCLAFSVK